MSNHIPFLFLKSGNISRKFVTKKMRSCDKNFGQLHEGITEEEGVRWMQGIEKYLESFNTSGEKEYDIHASYGYVCRVLKDEDSMETYIKESDEMMYKNKVENKRRRGEPLR